MLSPPGPLVLGPGAMVLGRGLWFNGTGPWAFVQWHSEIPMIDLTWSFQSTLQICPLARCAGWAWNPKGTQITPFCHQMGRRGTMIWDLGTAPRGRISLRISPGGFHPLTLNFFPPILDPKNAPFCHQLGRHPTIFQTQGGLIRRISARISPDRSHPLNLNFFLTTF